MKASSLKNPRLAVFMVAGLFSSVGFCSMRIIKGDAAWVQVYSLRAIYANNEANGLKQTITIKKDVKVRNLTGEILVEEISSGDVTCQIDVGRAVCKSGYELGPMRFL